MAGKGESGRAVAPVIGNVLLVAVVVVLASVLVIVSFAFLDTTGTPTAEASFEYERTSVGLQMTPVALGTDVDVRLNGKAVTSFESDSAGESVLLPTGPGDTVTVISKDEDRSILVQKRIDDRSEVGDFIAYYTFDSGSDETLRDRSGNDNDGEIVGEPTWGVGSLEFDGQTDHVTVSDLSSPVDVDEFTIVATYRTDDPSAKQELVEHKSGDDNWLLELKPCTNSEVDTCDDGDRYVPVFSVDRAGGNQDGQVFGTPLRADTRHTLVGTFDGEEYTLYVDGEPQRNGTYSGEISMGDMSIAQDIEFDGDYFDGDIYELRLYYTAFDERGVEVLTKATS